jgi:hypothetical protein
VPLCCSGSSRVVVAGAAVGAIVVGKISDHWPSRSPRLRSIVPGALAEAGNDGLPAGGLLHLKESNVDTTTLLIIIVIVLLLGGGGWYGRGRWY